MDITWRRKFSWSLKRQQVWDFCLKAYYYKYLAQWEDLPHKIEIQSLLGLLTLEEFQKELLMDLIMLRMGGKSLQDLRGYLVDKLKNLEAHPHHVLLKPEASNLNMDRLLADMQVLLDNLIQSFEDEGEKKCMCRVEEKFYYHGIPVNIKADFVILSPEEVIVRKIEVQRGLPRILLELDAAMHICWAMERFDFGYDKVIYEVLYLREGEKEQLRKSREELDELGKEMLERAQRMLLIRDKDELRASPQGDKCIKCPFSSICPESLYKI